MTSNQPQQPKDLNSTEGIKSQITQVAENIHSTIAINAEQTKALMKLPPIGKCDQEVLALAIEQLLSQFFKISLPSKAMMKLKNNNSIKFSVTSAKEDTPPLSVTILLAPDKPRVLSVHGDTPKSGTNGYSVLVFHWQQESGVVDKQGNINLKKVNKLPGVQTGDLLAKIYNHTNGYPGVSCFGKRLQQAKGIPISTQWDEESVSKIDDTDDTTGAATYQLYAKKGGIVQFSLGQEKNPKTLSHISISDTITIHGDVDYGVGDQGEIESPDSGCESNIIIEGSVRGIFSIQSKGYIHVNKAIEGTVAANDVKTDLITYGSSVTAKHNLTAGSIINATAKARTIIVRENTNSSSLKASNKIIFEAHSNCMSLKAKTLKVQATSTRFSGVNSFTLAEELLGKVEEHAVETAKIKKITSADNATLKTMASVIVDHLALLNSIVRKKLYKAEPEAIRVIDQIKSAIVAGFQSVDTPIDKNVIPASYRLQTILGKHRLDDSVLYKVDLLIKSITQYTQKETEVAPYIEKMKTLENKLDDLRKQLNEVALHFADIELLSAGSELRIFCGEAELILTQQNIPEQSFTVIYQPPDEIEKLRKGTLKIKLV